jgi:hypothetical protein
MEDIVIRDEMRMQEVCFKLNAEGQAIGIEIFFDTPRPMSHFLNYQAMQVPPAPMRPGPMPPAMPRPCGGSGG